MRSYLRIFAALMVVGLSASSNSEAAIIIRPDSDYVAYGATFDGVGHIDRTDDTGAYVFNASGVLVKSNWVLMSAHQALAIDSDLNSAYGSFRFGTGSNYFTNPGEQLTASELFIHPTYGGAAGSGYDLALLYFENPFTTVTPINLYTGTVANGMDATIVGYGRLHELNDTTGVLTGDRRAGDNPLIRTGFYAPNYTNTVLYDDGGLQMGATPGDSGGALLINNELAAIISTSTQGYYGTGHRTAYSLVDHDWFNTTTASRPSTSVPEPSSILLLLSTTGPALFFRRRRRTA